MSRSGPEMVGDRRRAPQGLATTWAPVTPSSRRLRGYSEEHHPHRPAARQGVDDVAHVAAAAWLSTKAVDRSRCAGCGLTPILLVAWLDRHVGTSTEPLPPRSRSQRQGALSHDAHQRGSRRSATACFAIAITLLLVLDLRVPQQPADGLGHALWFELWPNYFAYVVASSVIGIMWINHHAVSRQSGGPGRPAHPRAQPRSLLMTVSALPFTTSLRRRVPCEGGGARPARRRRLQLR